MKTFYYVKRFKSHGEMLQLQQTNGSSDVLLLLRRQLQMFVSSCIQKRRRQLTLMTHMEWWSGVIISLKGSTC